MPIGSQNWLRGRFCPFKLIYGLRCASAKIRPQNRYRNLRNLLGLLDFGKELLESHAGSFTMSVEVPAVRIRCKSNL